MKKIYIAHPFTTYGNPEENFHRQEEICKKVFELGHIPVSPIITFGKVIPHDEANYEMAMDACFWLLSSCDEVWFFGEWEKSKGCKLEYEFAISLGYRRLNHTDFVILSKGGGYFEKLAPGRLIKCPECLGDGCKDCYGGVIRVPTRSEINSLRDLITLRTKEVQKLRKSFPESAIIPCGVCGKLMQNHSKLGESFLCPMDGPSGFELNHENLQLLSDPTCYTGYAEKSAATV